MKVLSIGLTPMIPQCYFDYTPINPERLHSGKFSRFLGFFNQGIHQFCGYVLMEIFEQTSN